MICCKGNLEKKHLFCSGGTRHSDFDAQVSSIKFWKRFSSPRRDNENFKDKNARNRGIFRKTFFQIG
jgi:hypothetical protein